MRPGDVQQAAELKSMLESYSQQQCELRGIKKKSYRIALVEQMLESIRRVKYVKVMGNREVSPLRAVGSGELFDPVRGAIHFIRQGQIDEACWLTFMFTHFGQNRRTGWRLASDVYGRLGGPGQWNWTEVSYDPSCLQLWLHQHIDVLRGADGVKRSFGNHRKYQSLDAYSKNGTGEAVVSYVRWVKKFGSHQGMFDAALAGCKNDPRKAFDNLYASMSAVKSFGRVARFDYLAMIGKLGIADICPGSPYLSEATGPLMGARLLFGNNNLPPKVLDSYLIELDKHLNVGMQVLEDSLCNWQKSPNVFKPFRG